MTVTVDPVSLEPERIAAASRMLARAFDDDPPNVFLFPDDAKRTRVSRWNAALMCRYGLRYGRVDTTPDAPDGVAIWLPPEKPFVTFPRLLLMGGLPGPFITGFGEFRRFVSWSQLMERLHKRDVPRRHWYLAVLGVDPPRQGNGLGGALMQPVLARADREGLPCYLETAKEINIRFYRKHGFDVVAEVELPGGGPPLWTMKREPVR